VRVRKQGAAWTLTVRVACCSALPSGAYVAAAALTPLPGGTALMPAFARFRVR
jgi:hypothetical protein